MSEDVGDLWERSDMRHALLARDVAMLYRTLNRRGISQRLIAAHTGQSQSEISEILHGRRILSYDVLERICVGLMIPPGHMGMAYDDDTIRLLGPLHPQWPKEPRPEDEGSARPFEVRTVPTFPRFDTGMGDDESRPSWLDKGWWSSVDASHRCEARRQREIAEGEQLDRE